MAILVWFAVIAVALLAAVPARVGAAGAGVAEAGSVDTSLAGAAGSGSAGCAEVGGGRCWPVAGPGIRGRPVVLRGFEPPPTPWAAGHRGVDLRAGPGAVVRAAAPGEVAFAGRVAGTGVLVLRIAGGLRISYEPVRATLAAGARVAAGEQVGVLEPGGAPGGAGAGAPGHCAESCLHWGLRRGDPYLDPLSLLPPSLLRAGPSRLLPVYGARAEVVSRSLRAAPS